MITLSTIFFLGFLAKVSALLVVALLTVRLIDRAEPRWRVAISRAAILAIPAVLLADAVHPFAAIPWYSPVPPPVEHVELLVPAPIEFAEPAFGPSVPMELLPSPQAWQTLPFWIFATWGLIALYLLCRECLLLLRFSKPVRKCPPAPESVACLWMRICGETGIPVNPIKIVDTAHSPFIAPGGVVLIPRCLLGDDSGGRVLEHVLRHEAAHLKSGDPVWIPAARFLACLLWFHPLAWWLASEHLRACEESADADAARRGGTEDYRSAIAQLALHLIPMRSPVAVASLRLPSIRMRLDRVQTNARLAAPSRRIATSVLFGMAATGAFLGNLGLTEAQAQEAVPAEKTLREIVIPEMEFKKTPLVDTIGFLQGKTEKVTLVIGPGVDPKDPVTLRLTNYHLLATLDAVAHSVDADLQMEGARVTLIPKRQATEPKPATPGSKAAAIQAKLDSIIIPEIKLNDTPLHDALDFLRSKARELDKTEPKGLNMMIEQKVDSFAKVTLHLESVPLGTALKYVTELGGAKYRVLPSGVMVEAGTISTADFYTATYRVKDLFEDSEKIRPFLESKGVQFPPKSALILHEDKDQLIVRNSRSNMNKIAKIVNDLKGPKPTIVIALDADGVLTVDREKVDLKDLRTRLSGEARNHGVILRMTDSTPFGQVNEIQQLCCELGFTKIDFASGE